VRSIGSAVVLVMFGWAGASMLQVLPDTATEAETLRVAVGLAGVLISLILIREGLVDLDVAKDESLRAVALARTVGEFCRLVAQATLFAIALTQFDTVNPVQTPLPPVHLPSIPMPWAAILVSVALTVNGLVSLWLRRKLWSA
jgi:hypothetical protein